MTDKIIELAEGRFSYSRATRMQKGDGEYADDSPYYYDMASKRELMRVNAWLAATAKRATIDPDSVYQEIKTKLQLLGIVLPNYTISGEDVEEGGMAFEAEWYPGYTEGEDGGLEKSSLSAEKIPGGLWMIMDIDMEDGRHILNMKLVAGADYFEDEELDGYEDEEPFEDEMMSEADKKKDDKNVEDEDPEDSVNKTDDEKGKESNKAKAEKKKEDKEAEEDDDDEEDEEKDNKKEVKEDLDEAFAPKSIKIKDISEPELVKSARKFMKQVKKAGDNKVVVYTKSDIPGHTEVSIVDLESPKFNTIMTMKNKNVFIVEDDAKEDRINKIMGQLNGKKLEEGMASTMYALIDLETGEIIKKGSLSDISKERKKGGQGKYGMLNTPGSKAGDKVSTKELESQRKSWKYSK